jgi:ribosomal protein L11 methyltransferase
MTTKTYYQFAFDRASNPDFDLIVALLSDLPFEGFDESDDDVLHAYIRAELFEEAAFKKALDSLPACSFLQSEISMENWNSKWERDFNPVIIDDFASVRADFHPRQPGVQYEVTITPKMSFGTGHHATTEMMIRQMRTTAIRGKNVLDFGTGTGILAILAEKMGAAHIDALDNDDWSIENAAENIRINGCSRIRLFKGERIPENRLYEVLLANINLNVIIGQLPRIAQVLAPEGVALLSGFLKSDEQALCHALASNNLKQVADVSVAGWLAVKCLK